MSLKTRCGQWMPRAEEECGRPKGHSGPHSSGTALHLKAERLNERRRLAREAATFSAQAEYFRRFGPIEGVCGHWMPLAKEPCGRPVGHTSCHQTATTVSKQREYWARYARTEAGRASLRARRKRYLATAKGRATTARLEAERTISGRGAAHTMRAQRRKADDRSAEHIDDTIYGDLLATLLGGFNGQTEP